MLCAVQKANQRLRTAPPEPGDLSIFSMDAEALYPSLHIDDIMEGIMDIVASSPIEFRHVNVFEMTKFLHVMYTEEQLKEHGVDKNIPDRQVELDGKVRQRPSLAYLDSDVYTKTVNGVKFTDVQKWVNNGRKPSEQQKRKIIALTLMAVTKTILQNHIYSFNGKYYKQKSGGPIGEDIATKTAKVVMYRFLSKYKEKLVKLSLSHHIVLLKIYVDDLNQAGFCLPLGSRYARGKLYIPGQGWRGRASPGQALSYQEKKAIEDEGNAEKEAGGDQCQRELNSARIFRQIANDVLPKTIRMKEDIPGNQWPLWR